MPRRLWTRLLGAVLAPIVDEIHSRLRQVEGQVADLDSRVREFVESPIKQ